MRWSSCEESRIRGRLFPVCEKSRSHNPETQRKVLITQRQHVGHSSALSCAKGNTHELQIRRHRRLEGLFSRSRQSHEPSDGAPPWIPIVLTYVSQPDGATGGQVLPDRAGLS